MYQPRHFEETRPEELHALVRSHPLATLVTWGPQGLEANHIPLYLRTQESGPAVLVGHVARANGLWQEADRSVPVLAIFQAQQHYVSPGWYASKAEHGKVVPTWNYMVVHAKGRLQVHDDAAWVRQQMTELTTQQEHAMAHPWSVDDAPSDYTDTLLRHVVGISIAVEQWSGKNKLSQNQPADNQRSVVAALQALGGDDAQAMAHAIQARGTRSSPP